MHLEFFLNAALALFSFLFIFSHRTPASLAPLATAHYNREPADHVSIAHHPRCPPRTHRGDGCHASTSQCTQLSNVNQLFRPMVSIRSSP